MADTKPCSECGQEMRKPRKYSQKQWESKSFCSRTCAAKARKNRVKVDCANCGDAFDRVASAVRQNNFEHHTQEDLND